MSQLQSHSRRKSFLLLIINAFSLIVSSADVTSYTYDDDYDETSYSPNTNYNHYNNDDEDYSNGNGSGALGYETFSGDSDGSGHTDDDSYYTNPFNNDNENYNDTTAIIPDSPSPTENDNIGPLIPNNNDDGEYILVDDHDSSYENFTIEVDENENEGINDANNNSKEGSGITYTDDEDIDTDLKDENTSEDDKIDIVEEIPKTPVNPTFVITNHINPTTKTKDNNHQVDLPEDNNSNTPSIPKIFKDIFNIKNDYWSEKYFLAALLCGAIVGFLIITIVIMLICHTVRKSDQGNYVIDKNLSYNIEQPQTQSNINPPEYSYKSGECSSGNVKVGILGNEEYFA